MSTKKKKVSNKSQVPSRNTDKLYGSRLIWIIRGLCTNAKEEEARHIYDDVHIQGFLVFLINLGNHLDKSTDQIVDRNCPPNQ